MLPPKPWSQPRSIFGSSIYLRWAAEEPELRPPHFAACYAHLPTMNARRSDFHAWCFPGAAPVVGKVNTLKIALGFYMTIKSLLARPERFELPTPRFVV